MRMCLGINSEEFSSLSVILYNKIELGLTKKEAEIISMLLHNWPISKIASYLSREEKTIHKHLQNIKKKLSCPTLFVLGAKISEHLSKLQQTS